MYVCIKKTQYIEGLHLSECFHLTWWLCLHVIWEHRH